MQIAIVQLTDIHISKKTDLNSKIEPIVRAIISRVNGCKNIFVITSGDIAFSGKKEEYEIAKKFYSLIKTLIKREKPEVIIDFLFVPGNHDCDFSLSTQVRKNELSRLSYSSLGNDSSVINELLKVQDEFWNFYSNYQTRPEDKLFYNLKFPLEKYTLNFICINTAWCSELEEQPGKIFFPIELKKSESLPKSTLNICIWHHPFNWFNPNTTENNKLEFQNYVEQNANIGFFGHEHEKSLHSVENHLKSKKLNLISGEILHEDKKAKKSGFNVVKIDLDNLETKVYSFGFTDNFYSSKAEHEISISKQEKSFEIDSSFQSELETLKVPLSIENRKVVKLPEIFVYPDLEPSNHEYGGFDNFVSSERLLNEDGHFVIKADEQAGKTSLLYHLFLDFHKNGKIPLYIDMSDFRSFEINKYIRRRFSKQYKRSKDELFEKYLQADKKEKILLIDNFNDCEFNTEGSKKILVELSDLYGKIIVVNDSSNSLLTNLNSEFFDFVSFTLKPLGFKKRNQLIEKYHKLKSDEYRVDEDQIIRAVRESFDKVQSILGDKLIPSSPVFILSILQALEYKPVQQNETSFGYCYQTLIHYSLYKAGIENAEIDSYFNFLTELAYFIVKKSNEEVTRDELSTFYNDYEKKYIIDSFNSVISFLKKSKILIEKDNEFWFGYKYILYYLSAKKISDIVHQKEGKDFINKLFEKLHIERNANILVFITHHSKDISFIEQTLFTSMLILENQKPISLEKTDEYYKLLNEFTQKITDDVLELNRNPKEEREKQLEKKDKLLQTKKQDRKSTSINTELFDDIIIPFHQAFRVIEILGQIVKNRKGSLPKDEITQMVKEIYTTGFRTISYHSKILEDAKNEIIEVISKDLKSNTSKADVEEKINYFLQKQNLQTCLTIFSKITHSVGLKELKDIFNRVSNDMKNPAAQLLTFGINSYYGKVTVNELKEVAEELKDNDVALKILRARIRSYVYNNNVDYKDKQAFASILKMKTESMVMKKRE